MNITLRRCQESDLPLLIDLFRSTIWTVNAQDYTQEQLEVWAPDSIDLQSKRWQSLLHTDCIVACSLYEILGFANLTDQGLIDFFFVHHHHIHTGIGKKLLHGLEEAAQSKALKTLTVEASITALPFFEKQGFDIVQKQTKQKEHIVLINYLMKKDLKKD